MHCLLCGSDTTLFFVYKARDGQKFFRCTSCGCILLHPDYYVSEEDEKARYLTHNNDVNDKRYQRFVSPIVNAILNDFSKVDEGLDFGSGTGPVISKMLRDEGYQIRTYDPFFDPDTHALSTSYDYIAGCEVVEHFHQPAKEFARLSALLRPGGKLYLKTEL